jgi:hypothetical protein
VNEQQFPYAFESEDTRGALRNKGRAREEAQRIAGRLGFNDEIPATNFGQPLLELATHCNLAIAWYEGKIKKEVWARRGYFFVSLGTLLLIPITLYLIGNFSRLGQPTAVTAQMSAVLTGLLAFQRGVSAWLDRRQIVGAYAKASSDLKTLLYTFEQTWDTMATDSSHAVEFTSALRTITAKSRDIVRLETEAYYQTLSYPTLDLGSLVKSAASDAGTLIHTFGTPTSSVNDVAAAKIAQLRQRVGELDAQIRLAKSAGDNAVVVTITPQRDNVLKELRAAELNTSSRLAG